MTKTLGSYIRFIPEVDQDTLVLALSTTHRRSGVHRGMLAFIPIDELIVSLRQLATASTSAYIYQPNQHLYPRQIGGTQSGYSNPYLGTQTTSSPGGQQGLGLGIPQPIGSQLAGLGQALGNYIPPMNIGALEQQCLFAYASLVTAIGIMKMQTERDEEIKADYPEEAEKVPALA